MTRLLLAMMVAYGFSAHSLTMYEPTFGGPMPELPDYSQMALMAPHKRVEYIKELRSILIDMEKLANKKTAQSEVFRRAIASLLQQMTILDEAQAAADDVPTFSGGMWRCGGIYEFNKRVGTCVIKNLVPDCPANHTRIVTMTLAGFSCVPNASWSALPPSRRTALASNDPGRFHAAGTFEGRDEGSTRALVLGPASSGPAIVPTDATGRPPLPGAALTHGPGINACKELLDKGGYNQEDHRRALNDFMRTRGGTQSCLMGGFFSDYKDNKVKKGKCKRIGEWPSGTGDDKFKCTKPGESMCNPLMFCANPPAEAGGKPTPICKPIGVGLTYSCEEHVKANNISCDPFAETSNMPRGTREAWGEFKTNFQALCAPHQAFVKFYCMECKIMSDRFASLNQKYPAGPGESPTRAPPATTER